MLQFIKNLFRPRSKADIGALIAKGALIMDVRTGAEYVSGHIKGSINIPLSALPMQMAKLNKDRVVITCCASGMRSRSAKNILKANGFPEVYNGGNWESLKKYNMV